MAKRMLIDATHPEETRVAVVNGSRLEEYDFETVVRKQLKSNIYLVKVSRVEPSLQACFVDFGGNRHGFLPFPEIHPDYYRIPIADREALIAEERALAAAQAAREDAEDEAELAAAGESVSDAEEDDIADEAPEANVPYVAAELSISAEIAQEESDDETDDTGAEADEEELETADDEESEAVAGADDAASGDDAAEDKEPDVEIIGGDVVDAPVYRSSIKRRYKIQEVIKRGQVMLIQVSKEERGNKGAAVTSYISLPGRYCVLMPNSPRGGGVSRKVSNAKDRQRLKKILQDLNVPEGMSVILRTAGVARSTAEIKRDLDYLLRLWDQIRELTLKSSAPALIYEEGNLIKRAIRDLYKRDIDEVHVAGEEGYRSASDFMRMLMPSHVERVKFYNDESMPLFSRYQVESQIDAIHNPTVHLRSGGYIVINPTEALVSIDVNSGKATKGRHIEETALKTNLEAADEVARQLRLRDMGGLVVIDFIDMEDNRSNRIVERKMRDAMQHDRARIQLGRISTFGLMELSRQRLHPSLVETNFEVCKHCAGSGLVRTIETTGVIVLRAIEEEGLRARASEIRVSVPTDIAVYILNNKRDHLATLEKRHNMKVSFNPDDELLKPNYAIDIIRAAGYVPPALQKNRYAPVSSVDISDLPELDPSEITDDGAVNLSLDDEFEGARSEERGERSDRGDRESGSRDGRRRRRRGGRDRDRDRDRDRPRERGGERHAHEGREQVGSAPESIEADAGFDGEQPDDSALQQPRLDGDDNNREGRNNKPDGEGRRRRGRRGGRNRGGRNRGGRDGQPRDGQSQDAQGGEGSSGEGPGSSDPSGAAHEERRNLPEPANEGQDSSGEPRKGWWKRLTDA